MHLILESIHLSYLLIFLIGRKILFRLIFLFFHCPENRDPGPNECGDYKQLSVGSSINWPIGDETGLVLVDHTVSFLAQYCRMNFSFFFNFPKAAENYKPQNCSNYYDCLIVNSIPCLYHRLIIFLFNFEVWK